jgi:hypothetical protein
MSRIAMNGVGPRLYWKLPIRPCTAPSTKSARYPMPVTSERGEVPMSQQATA